MKEFIEKLIERLEEEIQDVSESQGSYEVGSDMSITCSHIMGTLRDVKNRIIPKLVEEYSANTPQKSAVNLTTNADRIRSMTDEELAEFFEKLEVVCDMCAFKVGCCNIVSGNCKSGLLKWLQSEVEGVTENE